MNLRKSRHTAFFLGLVVPVAGFLAVTAGLQAKITRLDARINTDTGIADQ
ncbi:MAG: hypothetical protein QUS35_12285 [bacterium]|nr:hypothetical protein [bacterium]